MAMVVIHISGIEPTLEIFKLKYSNSLGTSHFDWKRSKETVNIINQSLKLINPNLRAYDPDTRTWTFSRVMFDTVKMTAEALSQSPVILVNWKLHTWDEFDLFFGFSNSNLNQDTPPAPEDFFKAGTAASTNAPVITKQSIQLKLKELTGFEFDSLEEPKKIYRKAAMILHPDRNNGDGTKMSELNYLWQEYQKYV